MDLGLCKFIIQISLIRLPLTRLFYDARLPHSYNTKQSVCLQKATESEYTLVFGKLISGSARASIVIRFHRNNISLLLLYALFAAFVRPNTCVDEMCGVKCKQNSAFDTKTKIDATKQNIYAKMCCAL